jgi:hypothetical protein
MREKQTRRVPVDLRSLTATQEIFRVSAAANRETDIDAWLADVANELRQIARYWIAQMRECGDDVRLLIHDGCPAACIGDAPFGYVNAFATHVNVGFFYGASLSDPRGLFVGSGKRMRHVKIRPQTEVDSVALRSLVRAAYADLTSRLDAEISKTP